MIQRSETICLVGFMGTGKSTISKLLAEQLGCRRVDSDEEIERRIGCSISAYFAAEGEAAFRKLESEVLAGLLQEYTGGVISTGGGAVLAEYNRALMLANSFVVALKATDSDIIARTSHDATRPLLAGDGKQKALRLLEARRHAYDFAHFSVDTSSLTPEQAAAAIVAELEARQ